MPSFTAYFMILFQCSYLFVFFFLCQSLSDIFLICHMAFFFQFGRFIGKRRFTCKLSNTQLVNPLILLYDKSNSRRCAWPLKLSCAMAVMLFRDKSANLSFEPNTNNKNTETKQIAMINSTYLKCVDAQRPKTNTFQPMANSNRLFEWFLNFSMAKKLVQLSSHFVAPGLSALQRLDPFHGLESISFHHDCIRFECGPLCPNYMYIPMGILDSFSLSWPTIEALSIGHSFCSKEKEKKKKKQTNQYDYLENLCVSKGNWIKHRKCNSICGSFRTRKKTSLYVKIQLSNKSEPIIYKFNREKDLNENVLE